MEDCITTVLFSPFQTSSVPSCRVSAAPSTRLFSIIEMPLFRILRYWYIDMLRTLSFCSPQELALHPQRSSLCSGYWDIDMFSNTDSCNTTRINSPSAGPPRSLEGEQMGSYWYWSHWGYLLILERSQYWTRKYWLYTMLHFFWKHYWANADGFVLILDPLGILVDTWAIPILD